MYLFKIRKLVPHLQVDGQVSGFHNGFDFSNLRFTGRVVIDQNAVVKVKRNATVFVRKIVKKTAHLAANDLRFGNLLVRLFLFNKFPST